MTARQITRDEALLHLNDHCGSEVEATITYYTPDAPAFAMNAKGTLRHWRDHPDTIDDKVHTREDLIGVYTIGDAMIDITEQHEATTSGIGLVFDLSDGVTLSVMWKLLKDSPDDDSA